MVAAAAVRRAAGRIAAEAAFERGGLDSLVELEAGVERRAAGAIGHQFDRPEQAAASDVADVTVIAKPLGQAALELSSAGLHLVEQMLVVDDPLHLERGGAGQGMGEIGVSVLERA